MPNGMLRNAAIGQPVARLAHRGDKEAVACNHCAMSVFLIYDVMSSFAQHEEAKMAYGKMVVLLFKESGVIPPFQPQWYRDYFLSTNGGVGAYWFKQSNGNCWFEGDVLGWYEFSVLPDFTNRAAIAEAGIRDADAQTGWPQGIQELYDTAI